jgi:hypothetical protein
MKIIKVIGLATGVPTRFDNHWCRDFNFESGLGRGLLLVTENWEEAKRFEDFMAAMMFWRTQCQSVPLREDGKPNRPFTAWTIEVKDLGTAEGLSHSLE